MGSMAERMKLLFATAREHYRCDEYCLFLPHVVELGNKLVPPGTAVQNFHDRLQPRAPNGHCFEIFKIVETRWSKHG